MLLFCLLFGYHSRHVLHSQVTKNKTAECVWSHLFIATEGSMNKRCYQFRFSEKVTDLPPSSKIDLSSCQNRLFVDEVFGEMAEVKVTVNGISLNGRWEVETEDVGEFDYILRLIDRETRSSIALTFKDQEARLRAVEILETNRVL